LIEKGAAGGVRTRDDLIYGRYTAPGA